MKWGSDDRTYIYGYIGDNWSWDDIPPQLAQIRSMAASVPHRVIILVEIGYDFSLPPGGFSQAIKSLVQIVDELNIRCCIFVGYDPSPLELVRAALHTQRPQLEQYYFVFSIDEALAIIVHSADNGNVLDNP